MKIDLQPEVFKLSKVSWFNKNDESLKLNFKHKEVLTPEAFKLSLLKRNYESLKVSFKYKDANETRRLDYKDLDFNLNNGCSSHK